MSSGWKQYELIAAIIAKSVYHPVVKEKLIKIIQYYTQFLIAYYKNAAKSKLDRLKNIQYIMSTCRKSIRFGRCLNHVYNASQIISKIRNCPPNSSIDPYEYGELVEELFYVVHFYLDSRLLLYRAGVLTTNEKWMDNLFYIGDFGADLSVVIHSALKIIHLLERSKSLRSKRELILTEVGIKNGKDDDSDYLENIDEQLSQIAEDVYRAKIRLIIYAIQMIASGDFPPLCICKRIFGFDCPGTIVGLTGVLSSSLVIYDTIRSIAASS